MAWVAGLGRAHLLRERQGVVHTLRARGAPRDLVWRLRLLTVKLALKKLAANLRDQLPQPTPFGHN